MSTQTGIRCDDALSAFLGRCRSDGRVRAVKVSIRDEALVLDGSSEAEDTLDHDWDRHVLPMLVPDQPCFILVRMDEREGDNYRWVLVSWSPDTSSVRQKMLYASTKASLKKDFGGGLIKDDLYGNVTDDVSLSGYRRHLVSATAPGPLSREEIEREEVKQAQNDAAVGVDSRHQTMTGILFPMDDAAGKAAQDIRHKRTDYVRLSIDIKNEVIVLEEKGKCTPQELANKIPSDKPRYHLFVFRYTHEGDPRVSTVFVYTVPGYNCSIKERMLYSSCKNGLVERLQQEGVPIDKKIEVDAGEDITAEFLYSELHPVKNLHRPKFAKPAPPSRGNRRITKQPVL